MGFLPSVASIMSKIFNKIMSNKIFAAFFSLILPGQLFARHNYLNSNFDEYPWLYLPFFWFPPLSIVPMVMILTNKIKKQPKAAKLTLHDMFSNVILSVTTFCIIMWIPLIISLLTGDDKIGAIVDRYIMNPIFSFIAKAVIEVMLNAIFIYLITAFITYLQYSKKCRKLKKGIDFTQLLSLSLTPTMFATAVSAMINLVPPIKMALEILTAVLLGNAGKSILMIPLGIVMALAHFIGSGLVFLPKC
jgi:TM2 domain-containing membrane protein YozV